MKNSKIVEDFQFIFYHAFFKKRELPTPLDSATIHAIKQALENLKKVELSTYELKKVLHPKGSPATIQELKKCFEDFVNGHIKGKNPDKIRIVVE